MAEKERDAALPRDEDHILKMDILGMVHSAENPFDIIYHVANYLEEKSREAGYARHVLENMRTVYGVVLGEKKLLTDELRDVEARKKRIEETCAKLEMTEEETTRAGFAIDRHKKNIERLRERIRELKANGESLYFERR